MKKLIPSLIIALLLPLISFAENVENKEFIEDIDYKQNIAVWESWIVDLNDLAKDLNEKYSSQILFEWDTRWESTRVWAKYEKSFENFWDKKISLSIYKIQNNNKELITNKNISLFVYNKSIAILFEKDLWDDIEQFTKKAKEDWILVHNLSILSLDQIEKQNILESINTYKTTKENTSDYIIIWWSKDFLFDSVSKINTKIKNKKLNLVLISSFNINILKSYLQNFVSNKTWIEKIILLDEGSKYEVLKQAENIQLLEQEIIKNNYTYINLTNISQINELLFISKFVNNLSNKWFSTTNIYLILIIPFLLVWVSIFKHLIWLSTVWVLIPTTLTLLFIKLWILPTALVIIAFLLVNLALSKVISRYKLHYTPKINLLTIVNIIVFIIILNILDARDLIQININDIMFIIFFILISEKLITVIVSKEFNEYKDSLVNTMLFSLLAYIFFSINIIITFILAYPEIIILLIPISFIIGKFTWLRVTEYFRFKEVIKSIEE